MTDQHPLTDRICFNILSNKYDVSGLDWHKYQDEVDLMRAAADWQLKQVIEWMEANLMNHDFHDGWAYLYDDCSNAYIRDEKLLKDLKKAMRPTTTQEDN